MFTAANAGFRPNQLPPSLSDRRLEARYAHNFWHFSLLIFLSASLVLFAQAAMSQVRLEGVWHKGVVILADGDTLEAEFTITLSTDIIQARQGQRIGTFSARQVRYAYFSDSETGNMRYIFSQNYAATPNGYKVPRLFELVQEGRFASLFCRESIVNDNDMVMNPYTGMMMSRPYQRLVFDHYIRKQDRTITLVKYRKRDMLLILQDQQEGMRKYLEDTSPEYSNRQSLIKILEHYNNLCLSSQPQPKDTTSQPSPTTGP